MRESLTYSSAETSIQVAASPSSAFFTTAGAPAATTRGGIVAFWPTTLPAAINARSPIVHPLSSVALLPISAKAFDLAVLHYGAVSDGHVVADVRAAALADVDDRVVLNRGSLSDPDRSVVAAQDGAEPDARFLADLNVADQDGVGRHERRAGDLGQFAPIFDHHQAKLRRHARRTSPPCIDTGRRCAASRPFPAQNPAIRSYTEVNYTYAGRTGHIHEVVEIAGRSLAKVGFDDRKIVYYLLDDLELDESAKRGTFHDTDP